MKKLTLITVIIFTISFLTYLISSKVLHDKIYIHSLKNIIFDIQNQPNIVFVWNNSWNSTWYSINISCRNSIPPWFEYLPEDKAVEIILREDCKNTTIPQETFKILTEKRFLYVHWSMDFQGIENTTYQLTEAEALEIAKAPWEYIGISGFNTDIWRILRDTKNTTRKWYEPTGNPEIYTVEDKKICDILWWDRLKEWHEEEWRIQAEIVLECYRNLPPLQ